MVKDPPNNTNTTTRRTQQLCPSHLTIETHRTEDPREKHNFVSAMLTRLTVMVIAIVLSGLAYKAIRPPPPKLCGSPNGPTINSPRVKLRDGRHLSYRESGVPRDRANYKIIVVHGFDSSKDVILPASQELVEKLGVYFLFFDRAGYGESDPNPKRNVKSEAMDIEEIADRLKIGERFHVIGISMGGYAVWSCLKNIPHRLAGAALVVPAINYWWPSVPAELSAQVYHKLRVYDRLTFWIAHNVPSFLYAWMTQKWFPTLAVLEGCPEMFSQQDKEIIRELAAYAEQNGIQNNARQQGVFESLHRDLIVLFSDWEFDPMNISNPFQHGDGSVHIWQGYDDRIVPVELQRFVAEKLPWIQYHEYSEGGHLFIHTQAWSDTVLQSLLLDKGQLIYADIAEQ